MPLASLGVWLKWALVAPALLSPALVSLALMGPPCGVGEGGHSSPFQTHHRDIPGTLCPVPWVL